MWVNEKLKWSICRESEIRSNHRRWCDHLSLHFPFFQAWFHIIISHISQVEPVLVPRLSSREPICGSVRVSVCILIRASFYYVLGRQVDTEQTSRRQVKSIQVSFVKDNVNDIERIVCLRLDGINVALIENQVLTKDSEIIDDFSTRQLEQSEVYPCEVWDIVHTRLRSGNREYDH